MKDSADTWLFRGTWMAWICIKYGFFSVIKHKLFNYVLVPLLGYLASHIGLCLFNLLIQPNIVTTNSITLGVGLSVCPTNHRSF